jgi:hypothetical protein
MGESRLAMRRSNPGMSVPLHREAHGSRITIMEIRQKRFYN